MAQEINIWFRLFFIFLMFYFLINLYNSRKNFKFYYFLILTLTFLIREIFLVFSESDFAFLCAESLVLLYFLFLFRQLTGFKKSDVFLMLLNLIILSLYPINYFLYIPNYPIFSINILLIFNGLYLIVMIHHKNLKEISQYQEALLLINVKYFIALLSILLASVNFFYNFKENVYLYFLMPLYYCVYLIVLIKIIDKEKETKIKTLNVYKDHQEELFDLINNVNKNLSYPLDLPKILEPFIISCNQFLNAAGSGILLFDENENFLHLVCSHGDFPELSTNPIIKGETILGKASLEGKGFIYDQDYIKKHGRESFIDYENINSLIIEPVILSNRIIGLIVSVKMKGRGAFSQRRINYIKFFSQYLAVLLNNIYQWAGLINRTEIQKEIDLSYFIHQKLISKENPKINQLSFAVFNQALKGTNGDYIDIIPLSDYMSAFVIADVAGKGIGSAAVLLIISSLIKLIVNYEKNPGKILSLINDILAKTTHFEQYSTMSILIYNNKSKCLYYSNAGHIPMTVLRNPYKKIHSVDIEGLPLGIESGINYKSKKINVIKDDLLILYTDGLVEAMNLEGKQYGYDRLILFIKENINLPLAEIINKLRVTLRSFTEGSKIKDDQTLLLIKLL